MAERASRVELLQGTLELLILRTLLPGPSHGHAIAKGADINKLMAEIAGRATGYCGGKGGSMHIVAKETGFITATGGGRRTADGRSIGRALAH